MISICMNDRQHVITNVWASVCQEISMYLSYFFIIIVFFSITQIFLLLYFSSAQINHLYDV